MGAAPGATGTICTLLRLVAQRDWHSHNIILDNLSGKRYTETPGFLVGAWLSATETPRVRRRQIARVGVR